MYKYILYAFACSVHPPPFGHKSFSFFSSLPIVRRKFTHTKASAAAPPLPLLLPPIQTDVSRILYDFWSKKENARTRKREIEIEWRLYKATNTQAKRQMLRMRSICVWHRLASICYCIGISNVLYASHRLFWWMREKKGEK